MPAGSIIIDLLMRTGAFETDTDRAAKKLEAFKKKAEAVGAAIGTGIVAGAGLALAAFGELAKSAGEFKDIEERVGASAESLASLSIAANIAGVSVDDLGGMMNKLTKNLSGVDDDSKAAGAALAALGVPITEFKKLDPVQQIDELQKAFGNFADGPQKSAVAMALFGKEGAKTLNVFKALEDTGGRQVILTQQQIELADAYGDRQAKLNATLKAYAQAAATDVLPALNDLSTAAKEVVADFTGIDASGKKLDTESPVKDFADAAVNVLSFVADAAQGVSRLFEVIGKTIGAAAAQATALAKGEFAVAKQITKEWQDDVDKVFSAEYFSQRIARIRDATKAALAPDPNQSSAENARLARQSAKPTLKFSGAQTTKSDAQSEAEKYLETLQKQLEKTKDLTAYETALNDIQLKRIKGITPDLQKQILAQAKQIDLAKQAKELRDGEVQTNTNIGKAQLDELDALNKSNAELEREIQLLGLDADQLAALELQQVRVTRAQKQSTLAIKEAQGVGEDQLQVLQAEIDALTKREELLNERAGKVIDVNAEQLAKKAGENTRDVLGDSIEEGILTGFRNGAKFIDVFLNELKAQFAKTILRPLIQPAVDASNKGFADVLGSLGALFGSFSGSPIVAGNSPESGTGEQIRGRHAIGGTEHAGGTYLVGEKGPELFRPSTSGRILPNSMLGGARPVSIQIANNGAPVRATSTTQETDAGTIVQIALEAVAADVQSGTGKVSRAIKGRGVSLNGSLPRRA